MNAERDAQNDTAPVYIEELRGETIDIDTTDLELYELPEILTEVQATIATMLGDETGAMVYHISGDVSATKSKALVDQAGTYSLVFFAEAPTASGTADYEIRLRGDWNVAEHEMVNIDDRGDIPVITRMTIVCEIDNVMPK
ncbi:MAG: hypothetical protein ACYC27_18845 [Armatimonadota bacterium]